MGPKLDGRVNIIMIPNTCINLSPVRQEIPITRKITLQHKNGSIQLSFI